MAESPETPLPQEVCSCGNVFAEDAVFCRRCGTRRPADEELGERTRKHMDASLVQSRDVVQALIAARQQLDETDERLQEEFDAHELTRSQVRALEAAHAEEVQQHEETRRRLRELEAAQARSQEELHWEMEAQQELRLQLEELRRSQADLREASERDVHAARVQAEACFAKMAEQREAFARESAQCANSLATLRERQAALEESSRVGAELQAAAQRRVAGLLGADEWASRRQARQHEDDLRRLCLDEWRSVVRERLEAMRRDARVMAGLTSVLSGVEAALVAATFAAWLRSWRAAQSGRSRVATLQAQFCRAEGASMRGVLLSWRARVEECSRIKISGRSQAIHRALALDVADKHRAWQGFKLALQNRRHAQQLRLARLRASRVLRWQFMEQDAACLRPCLSSWVEAWKDARRRKQLKVENMAFALRCGEAGDRDLRQRCLRSWIVAAAAVRRERCSLLPRQAGIALALRAEGWLRAGAASQCFFAWSTALAEKQRLRKLEAELESARGLVSELRLSLAELGGSEADSETEQAGLR
eukprot:TRINITY_DN40008_c0_g1_i1.p1 TRINITY_DN40008_c0_g1~~TRINITY_DN40008_c0_g1_i1.p1  ORF type:complete len:536 (+),score=133.28 TRINITY_DN40008_c0_g1_i1:130-1737(+)